MNFGLQEAKQIANAALHEAERCGVAISVSVCDRRGRLIFFETPRMTLDARFSADVRKV
jgi:uncharacterized protein GlcG (DUF336 family)